MSAGYRGTTGKLPTPRFLPSRSRSTKPQDFKHRGLSSLQSSSFQVSNSNPQLFAYPSSMPRALAVETSGRIGSIALIDGESILAEEQFAHGLANAAQILPII